jgi:hypothetical protein
VASSVPSNGDVEGPLRSAYGVPSASTCCSPPSFTRADHDQRRDNDDEKDDESCRFHKLLRTLTAPRRRPFTDPSNDC